MKLSKREEETENLLKQGLTQRQIAYKLKITRRTVREYIKRINQKKNQKVGDKGIEKNSN
ncbi:LuxR C-terminal-related transcriptional regulator [Sebaldella sp. S0638]|uniref:helix-turn-helix transcriptional regulator n=1 Tax=Sebaldella sp. S0638 TaxID=2957809 RepID=UPI00209DB0E6|nr:LuxR C-terminal-related transcriptional regulator [Sebaldella sp. S0638]MCP1226164.1 LuxR C-terminal-related transcriptional regulator [Sebaldella sp. S0638]